MIYLVTINQELFENFEYEIISVEKSIEMISTWNMVQFDTETSGKDPHICNLLCMQFGNPEGDIQIVVDCTCINPTSYKDILESKYIIGQNLKFDLQFLYNYGIIPRKIYDTMIVEQLLYLGYPYIKVLPEEYVKYNYDFPYSKEIDKKTHILYYQLSFSLKSIAYKYLDINIDKTVRGEIIWRGLDTSVILYAASDVKYLYSIMQKQLKKCKEKQCIEGAKLECNFVPAISYLEWCGIKLDETKWKAKMQQDEINLNNSLEALNSYCIKHPKLKQFVRQDVQLSLFEDINTSPYFGIDWQKDEAKQVFRVLGFNLSFVSKTTKEESDSIMEKVLATQKGIADEFLKLYFEYQGYYKVCSSFGQGHLNLINPITNRLHTTYKQIGTLSGRMSSGGGENNDLAKLKHLSKVKLINMQQLPHDEVTRACFVAEEGNLFCSCDWSAMEARCGAEVYNEKVLLDEFLYGSGDTHAAYAKVVFVKELEGIDTKDVKKKRPDLRSKVKSVEFAVQFGSDGTAVAPQLGVSIEEAKQLVSNLLKNMKGLNQFKIEGSKLVRKNGYVLVHEKTGHKVYWWDYNKWLEVQKSFTPEFWEDYKLHHKNTNDSVAKLVKEHFQAASKWDRMALNCPTQAGGAICLKTACTELFNWIVNNGYFGKILFCNFTHDEINSEFPKELKDTYPDLVASIMKNSAAKYYYKLPIPAEASVGDHWIH